LVKGEKDMIIQVEPQKLEQGALRIEQQSSLYEKSYQRLLQNVEAMQKGWQGKDNQAFTAQIEGFRKDFIQMHDLMLEYAAFLRLGANLYRKTQEERTMQARRLAN
jgi:WXG100 family type VII secretion target